MQQDWLSEFVEANSYSECGPRLLYWTGVSTIAGALRRKVWFDQEDYQWTPNFYILFVGEPGLVKKSTSIDLGMNLLRTIPEVNFGPEITNWQTLIQFIGKNRDSVVLDDPDRPFFHSSVTIPLSEFGTFFKADDKDLVTHLTNLWDGKLGTIAKTIKAKGGNDELVNSFVNVIAGATPSWMKDNFPASMIGGGYASRCIMLSAEDSGIDIAYPKYERKLLNIDHTAAREALAEKLKIIGEYKGDYFLSDEAIQWGKIWYAAYKATLRESSDELVRGFMARKQTHLHKMAMIICAARYQFPLIDVSIMEEANMRLLDVERDTEKIFGFVGQTKITQAARRIVDIVAQVGSIERGALYRGYFFRTMTVNEYREAVASALMSRLIAELPGKGLVSRPVPTLRLAR